MSILKSIAVSIAIYLISSNFGVDGRPKKHSRNELKVQNKYKATIFPSVTKRTKKSVVKPTKTAVETVIKRTAITATKPKPKPDVKLATKTPQLKSSSLVKLLHKESKYNRGYLTEYKKMIASLLLEESNPQFCNKEFLQLPLEIQTVKSLHSKQKANFPNCADLTRKSDWKKLKVLQLEDKNSVTLKENRQTGEKVVEKRMDAQKHYDKELDFFRHAHHGSNRYYPKFVCSMKGKEGRTRHSIVTEFVDGEKSHVMASVATWQQLRLMVAQLFNSIVELHKVGYVHCDLSPANVMVTRSFDVKLIDFGMAMPIGSAKGYRGSYYIRAPELHAMCPGKIDVGIDWWAFGATVSIWYYYHYRPEDLEKNGKDYPTYHFTPIKLRKKRFHSMPFPSEFPTDLRLFLSLFLTIDPELRTFGTERLQNMIRTHAFFNNFDWSTAEMC